LDADTLHELFAEFGPVSIRRMFGGMGVFADGLMIALVSREVIFLKADAETIPAFEQEGQAPFSYATRNGEHKLTSYWRMPDRLYDDTEELARWARNAHAVALRKAARVAKPRSAKPRAAKSRPAKPAKSRPAKRASRPAKQASRPAKRAKKKH
jgi:DNA transformation protein and related proteins